MAFEHQTKKISGGRGRGRLAIREDQIAISKQVNKKEGEKTIYYIGAICCNKAGFKPGKSFLVNVYFDKDRELIKILIPKNDDDKKYARTLQAETKSWKRKNAGRKAFVFVKINLGVLYVENLQVIKDKDVKSIKEGEIIFSVKNIDYKVK